MARYSSTSLPIPPIIEWGPAGDGFYAIAPRMPGHHFDDLDAVGMRRVLPSLFAGRSIDFGAEAQAHYETVGLVVPNFAERLRCYCLHEGIGGMAYSAFRDRWEEVELKARRVLELARA